MHKIRQKNTNNIWIFQTNFGACYDLPSRGRFIAVDGRSSLTKRSDDIFDSTRYTKVLLTLQKSRLKYTSNVKDIKSDLAMYTSHHHTANQYCKELESTTEKFNVCHDEIQEIGYGIITLTQIFNQNT